MRKKILTYNIMKINMKNVYIVCVVILLTILVAYLLFTNNRLEMFQTFTGAQISAQKDRAIKDYYLNVPSHENRQDGPN